MRSPWLVSRRALMLAGLVGPFGMGRGHAQQQAAAVDPTTLRFRDIVVDASRVAGLGARSTAAVIEKDLAEEARKTFADRLTPADAKAPRLVIRIDSIQLSSYAGTSGLLFDRGSSNTDYLEGAGLVMSGGRAIMTTPMMSALDASYSGAWNMPDIDQQRIGSICQHFSYWLRREMGL